MSKYAVIKIGSSQERVSVGDKLLVDNSFSETSLTPILVSPRKGQIVTEEKMMWSNIQSINIEMSKPPKPRHPEAPVAGEELMYVDLSREKLEDLYKQGDD